MSLSLEEIIDETLQPYTNLYTTEQMIEALRTVADDLEANLDDDDEDE
jgi:hypothetical protein